MSSGSQVSVVIVTWNSRSVLPGCLSALQEAAAGAIAEVVVVDNGSDDGTAELARAHGLGPTVIENGRNAGLSTANNQGIAATTAPFVLLANPDTAVTPGAIEALAGVLERHPAAAFAVPRLRYPDGSPQVSAGDLPGLREALLGRSAGGRSNRGDSGFWWDGWAHDEERRIGRGHECCYLVRRAAIDEIGPQDESFPLDWEGIDWAARAADAGWEVWFTPAAEVVHVGGASLSQAPLRWIAGSHLGMYRYFAKRATPLERPLLALVIAARGMVKAAGALTGRVAYGRHER